MNAMFSALGVLNVDHYAVTTRDLMATLKDYMSIPGAKLLRGPGENPAQGVYYAFVELNGMGVVEILSPLSDASPILSHLTSGGGAYHLCYAVQDLDEAIRTAEQEFGAKQIVAPKSDGAFDGRRVAFLFHSVHGLFELLEAYPANLVVTPKLGIDTADTAVVSSGSDSLRDKLQSVFERIVGKTLLSFEQISMQNCAEWDSFKHLMLIMEIEKEYEVNISASDMSTLDTLDKINTYLSTK